MLHEHLEELLFDWFIELLLLFNDSDILHQYYCSDSYARMSGKTLSRWRCSQAEIILDIIDNSSSNNVLSFFSLNKTAMKQQSHDLTLVERPLLNVLQYTMDYIRNQETTRAH